MGFDNECILNIQALAGEYFCPVCRTLVYPHEAVQTPCTHLYCKPCLTYVVSSTQACPYDGYLVTEAGSKPLMESNKALAETIGKTVVHCLYHRSGCVWQGPLSECTTHCSSCAFGNSPVVCNRCGIQIVHRQVQEHAQTCNMNGTNTQGTETAPDVAAPGVTVSADQSKVANQTVAPASQPQASQPANANPMPQPMPANTVPTSDQWYQQQYQQYYQQYPGYDPYQQAYQQYNPYQQQPAQQFPQPPLQLQNQVQPQAQPQFQLQAQVPMQPQPQVPSNGQPQPLYPQTQIQAQNQPVAPGHMPPQSYTQVQPQPNMQVPQYQQPQPQMHHPQPPQVQPHPQQPHFQPLPQTQPQSQPVNPQQPPAQPVGGHPSYPSQPNQQFQHVPPQQHPTGPIPSGQMPAQFAPEPPHMRPPQPHMLPPQGQAQFPLPPPHQRPIMHQVQQPMPQQYMQQPQTYPGQPSGAFPPHVRPPGLPPPMQQPPPIGFAQHPQIRPPPPMQQFPQSSGPPGIAPHPRPPQFDPTQPSVNPEQQLNQYAPPSGGRLEQEDKSPSLKKSESVASDKNSEVKSEAGVNNESLQGVQGDSATTQRVKEESKDGTVDHSPVGKSSHNRRDDGEVGSIDSVKQGEASGNFQASSEVDNGSLNGRDRIQHGTEQSPHPPVPYGQQQRPAAPLRGQPPNQIRPSGPGYMPHGPNQFGNFHPDRFANNNRGYEPQSRFSRIPQGEPVGPPFSSASLPHGPPDRQTIPRHPGLMEPDMYQNQRPPHLEQGPYGQPFGVESDPMRMNGAPPPPGHDMSSAPGFRDTFSMAPPRHHEQGAFKGSLKQFPGPPHNEDSPDFRSHSSRPVSGYGIDGPSRFLDEDPHGYGHPSAGGLHPNESGERPFSASMHDDNRGRFDYSRQNPEFQHGSGRHHSPGNQSRPFFDGREMDRHPYGERFPMGPPGHMHRGEFDGPGNPRSGEPFGVRRGEPGFGPFQDHGRPGESNGPGDFSHQPPFGESFANKPARPYLGEPGFRSSYSRQGFPNDGGFYPGGSDSFDPLRKRTLSSGWCRICKVDCESVEGLDMHGQTREHQRMAMDMVISIKQKNAKKQKTSKDHHFSRKDASKFRNAEMHARVNMS